MGNNEPTVDQSDLRIRSSYGLTERYIRTGTYFVRLGGSFRSQLFTRAAGIVCVSVMNGLLQNIMYIIIYNYIYVCMYVCMYVYYYTKSA